MLEKGKLKQLEKTATLIRKHIIDEVYHASSGHPGGSLSCTDILTVLYFHEMRIDPKIRAGLIEIDSFYLKDIVRMLCTLRWQKEIFSC